MTLPPTVPITINIPSSLITGTKGPAKNPLKRVNALLKRHLGVTLDTFIVTTLQDATTDQAR